MKQIELTNHLGLSKNIFTDWKSGKNTSYMKYLPQIAEFFGVSVDYLIGNETKPSIENDFTYAAYDELTHDLSAEQMEQLKTYANFLRQQQ